MGVLYFELFSIFLLYKQLFLYYFNQHVLKHLIHSFDRLRLSHILNKMEIHGRENVFLANLRNIKCIVAKTKL